MFASSLSLTQMLTSFVYFASILSMVMIPRKRSRFDPHQEPSEVSQCWWNMPPPTGISWVPLLSAGTKHHSAYCRPGQTKLIWRASAQLHRTVIASSYCPQGVLDQHRHVLSEHEVSPWWLPPATILHHESVLNSSNVYTVAVFLSSLGAAGICIK